VPLPGAEIQRSSAPTPARSRPARPLIPDDDTIPQNTEGDQYHVAGDHADLGRQPDRHVESRLNLDPQRANDMLASALFQDSTRTRWPARGRISGSAGKNIEPAVRHRLLAGANDVDHLQDRAGGGVAEPRRSTAAPARASGAAS
jgi:hypothetical protein